MNEQQIRYINMVAELKIAISLVDSARFYLPYDLDEKDKKLEREIIKLQNALIKYRYKIMDKASLPY